MAKNHSHVASLVARCAAFVVFAAAMPQASLGQIAKVVAEGESSSREKSGSRASAADNKLQAVEIDPIDTDLIAMSLWKGGDVSTARAELTRFQERLKKKFANSWREKWLKAWIHEVDVISQLSEIQRSAFMDDMGRARDIDKKMNSVADLATLESELSQVFSRIDGILDDRCPSYILLLDIRASLQCNNLKFGAALEDSRRVLKLRSELCGTWNQMYAIDCENLGNCALQAGDLVESEAVLKRCLGFRSAAYSPNSFFILLTKTNIASLNVSKSNYSEAIQQFAEVLTKEIRPLEYDNRVKAVCYYQLAIAFWRTEKIIEAEASFENSLSEYRKFLHSAHPRILRILREQIGFYESTFQPEKATKLRTEIAALQMKWKVVPQDP